MAVKKKKNSARAAGRPSKFDAIAQIERVQNADGSITEVKRTYADLILLALAGGNYKETAAEYAGIHKDTLYEWLKQGESDRKANRVTRFSEFADAVQRAMADAEVRDVALIGKAAETQWQAAAWRLERKFPDRWGRRALIDDETVSAILIKLDK